MATLYYLMDLQYMRLLLPLPGVLGHVHAWQAWIQSSPSDLSIPHLFAHDFLAHDTPASHLVHNQFAAGILDANCLPQRLSSAQGYRTSYYNKPLWAHSDEVMQIHAGTVEETLREA